MTRFVYGEAHRMSRTGIDMNSQMAFTQSCKSPMARFASDSFTLHRIPLSFRIPQPLLKPIAAGFRTSRRKFSGIVCQTLPNPADTSSDAEKSSDGPESVGDSTGQTASSSSNQGFPEFPDKNINRRVAIISTVSALALFLSARLDFGVSLKDLAAAALPYEEALSNGKPTVVEFYADWCEVCRELAPDVYKAEQQFKDRVNFVMLNVDNTKWEQELDEFGVEGIPHFAFLDKQGNEEGNVVGRLPRQYLLENVDALARGEASIPHARVVGQFSSAEARKVHQISDPRSHG
ncbi:thioredoxin-like protein HCF164, chloroplastic isoform X1 [Cucurbita pepo subsp. pepo]|uniref:thioredoxin-like protein HCF164, chloroplastic isoform X1 n=2 Tax=Cucurbita pepo subsp. pepo TaxID=3664 RepID=UPI000C9D73DE|nr:thioredoxin-like protein HCF164, chloroplastic isoform X1 [Cucurbita pepo subsp. pepo]